MEGNGGEESEIKKKGQKFRHVHNEAPSSNVRHMLVFTENRGLRGASEGHLTCVPK